MNLMNLNKQINPTFPSSTGNMGGANPIRDDVFNNLYLSQEQTRHPYQIALQARHHMRA